MSRSDDGKCPDVGKWCGYIRHWCDGDCEVLCDERKAEAFAKVKEIADEMRGFKRYATSDSNDCRYVAYWLYQTFADRIDEAIKEFVKGEEK